MKKLKLVGYPYKIKKNTAFIRNMFNSRLEVSKFIGASIRTVSSIRGQIKKPQRDIEGAFRATFEDRIIMSDIVFLRAWCPVEVNKYYNPVTDLLQIEKGTWQGMKTVFQLRKERGLSIPSNPDSKYTPIERKPRIFNPLKIPTSLQAELPFKSVPKLQKKRSEPTLETHRAVLLEPHEKERIKVIRDLNMIKNAKIRKQKVKKERKTLEINQKKDPQKEEN